MKNRQLIARAGVAVVAILWLLGSAGAMAQTCMTQAKMTPELRTALSDESLLLASAVKANDAARIEAASVAEYASNFAPTAYLVRTTSEKLANDTLHVAQVYRLDATARKAGDKSDADFSCPLVGSTSETDFSISGLPPGVYGFATVEAEGDRPWLLAFLLRQEGGAWKLAGFYPHARTAAGHDGLWYWNAARDHAKAMQMWTAWVQYGEADELLRPAGFVTSTNLDKLRSEQRSSAPPEIADGLGPETPLVVKGAGGAEFRFTSIGSEGSEDGKRVNLMLHLRADWLDDPAAARARNTAATKALIDAHKDLRQGFDGVWVFAEAAGHDPFATEQKLSEIP